MDRYAETCPCSCHGGGMDAPCDWDGGCAYLHNVQVNPDDPHARRCARKGNCPGYERHDTGEADNDGNKAIIRIGAPLQVARGLCATCRDITGHVIAGLEQDFWKLYAELGATQSAALNSDVVRSSRDIPIRANVRDIAARIVDLAVTWAEPIAERAGIDWDAALVLDHMRPHAALAKAVGVLRWHVERLIDHEPIEVRDHGDYGYSTFTETDGIDAAVELCELHQRTEAILGLTDIRHHLPADCPNCDCRTMFRDNGADHVYCARCYISYAEDDYHRLVLVLLEENKPAMSKRAA